MKFLVYGLDGKRKGDINIDFQGDVRPDLIWRAVVAEESWERQIYGTDPLAGKRTSAHYHGRRGIRYSMMNREMARMKRIHGSGFLHMTARFVPQAIKGRKAHPPKTEKILEKEINKKEWKKALISAIIASFQKDWVLKRGHKVDGIEIPIIVDDKIQEIKKSKEVKNFLESLGLKDELERIKERKIRAGKGKTRGRRYKEKKGPLIVVKEDKGIGKAAENIPGIDVVEFQNLQVKDLAPGTHPGRLTIWSEGVIKEIENIIKNYIN